MQSPQRFVSAAAFALACALAVVLVAAQENAPVCDADHPAYRPAIRPPLIRSWRHHPRPSLHENVFYLVRYTDHTYRPRRSSSGKYAALDMFHSSGIFASDKLATMYFQRPAKVYLFIGVNKQSRRSARLPGWTSEGYAELDGKKSVRITFGIHQHSTIILPHVCYVFSKRVTSSVDIPTKEVVRKAMRGIKTQVLYHVRVAESDGSAYPGTSYFAGSRVQPNKRCPDKLHAAWAKRHPDRKDSSIRRMRFDSWHPNWDPCFWCAYDHDHGSSPKHLMDYTPTYTYTAYKNNNEKENGEGFKGYVFESGPYIVYVNIHVQAAMLRRVTAQYHTIAVVVKLKSTLELLVELTHKANFGFLCARGKRNGQFFPLTKKDEKMKRIQRDDGRLEFFRSVNVLDPNYRDPRFRFRPNMYEGVYEAWQTVPICSKVGAFGHFHVDIKTPQTGIKSVKSMEKVQLGLGKRNVGLSRMLRIKDVEIAAEHCDFENGGTSGGYFYTNADGSRLLEKPGPMAIRQFIKPGVKVKLDGRYEPAELGTGLHKDVNGFFADHTYGIDPDRN